LRSSGFREKDERGDSSDASPAAAPRHGRCRLRHGLLASRGKEGAARCGALSSDIEDAFVCPSDSVDPNQPGRRQALVTFRPARSVAGTPMDRKSRGSPSKSPTASRSRCNGFYMDEYAYPNEAGAIPKTGMNRDEAAALCATQGKTLVHRARMGAARARGRTTRLTNTANNIGRPSVPPASRRGLGAERDARDLPGARSPCTDWHGGPWAVTSSTGAGAYDAPAGGRARGNGEPASWLADVQRDASRPRLRRPTWGTCCAGEATRPR